MSNEQGKQERADGGNAEWDAKWEKSHTCFWMMLPQYSFAFAIEKSNMDFNPLSIKFSST